MLAQHVGHVAAERNNLQVPIARDFQTREHEFPGDALTAKWRGNLGVGEDHSISVNSVGGKGNLPVKRHLKALLGFVVHNEMEVFHTAGGCRTIAKNAAQKSGSRPAYVVSFCRIILNVHPPKTAVNRKRAARCNRTSVTEPRPHAVI